MTETAIRIWMREDVPPPIAALIPHFDAEEEPVVCVLHLPRHVMAHPAYDLITSLKPHPKIALDHPAFRWLSLTEGLFGSNAHMVYDHPEGDGLILVCYNV